MSDDIGILVRVIKYEVMCVDNGDSLDVLQLAAGEIVGSIVRG